MQKFHSLKVLKSYGSCSLITVSAVLICEVCIQFEFFRVSSGASNLALAVKNQPTNAEDGGDWGLIPGSGRSPGGGHSDPLQDSCLEDPWTEEPNGLQSVGWRRVGHDWSVLACSTHTVSSAVCFLLLYLREL